jgi:hypothetical protein
VLAIGLNRTFGDPVWPWGMRLIHELLIDVLLVDASFDAVASPGQADWSAFFALIHRHPVITLSHLLCVVLIARLVLIAIHHLIAQYLSTHE